MGGYPMRWLMLVGALALSACETGPAPSCEPSDVVPEQSVWWCGTEPSLTPPVDFEGASGYWTVGCFAPDAYVDLVAGDRGVIEYWNSDGSGGCVQRSEWDGVTRVACVIEDEMGPAGAAACGSTEYPPCPEGTSFRCLYPETGLCEVRGECR